MDIGPFQYIFVSGVGGLSGLRANVPDERADDVRVFQDDDVVHRVVHPP